MTTATVRLITFPSTVPAAKPIRDQSNVLITALEAGGMVENLEGTWFGGLITSGANVLAGKSVETYDEAAKAIGEVCESLRKDAHEVLADREKDLVKRLAGPDLADARAKVSVLKDKVNNNIKSAKSVLTNCVKHGSAILDEVTDGGHILWRGDGSPRGKTELQGMLKAAKSAGRSPKSDVERAMAAGRLFADKLAPLHSGDRTMVVGSFNAYLNDLLNEAFEEAEAAAA